MASSKYNRLFTEEDVREIVALMDPSGFDAGSADAAIRELGNEAKFPADEPLFVLRGQDRYALDTIEHYYDLCENAKLGDDHMQAVEASYHLFADFRSTNPERVKDPD